MAALVQQMPEPLPLMDQLRRDTRTAHRALEQQLDLLDTNLDISRYARLIECFYGFYSPMEASLLNGERWPWSELGLDPQQRRKSGWLIADLRALGAAPPESLPLCAELPDLTGADVAFGCLYVLEGATLGGRVISRHLTRSLGIGPANGARFHYGYGDESAPMWQGVHSAAARLTAWGADADAVVHGANATFTALARWHANCDERGMDHG